MNAWETPLEMAERHAREMTAHVARQREILNEMVQDDHFNAAKMAEKLLHDDRGPEGSRGVPGSASC
jgi:hypothetical protein